MKKLVADRILETQLFLGRVMSEKARVLERKGERLVHFELGEPDFPTPAHIKNAAKCALDEDCTHYTPNAGVLELRQAISEKLKKDNNITADPASQICVTVGAQEAVYLAIMCTIEPQDEVLLPEPGYYTYRNCVKIAQGTPVSVPLKREDDFRLNPQELEKRITPRSKMVVVNSPSNPAGSVMTEDDLRSIDEIAVKHDILVLVDEIYEKIMYDGCKHYSFAALSDDPSHIITVNGFSKAYAMTGWRIGYVFASALLTSQIVKMQSAVVSCATTFAQKGAIEALRGPQESLLEMVKEFKTRRNTVIDGLNEVEGFSVNMPKGAFYAFPNVEELGKPSSALADYLLNEAKVVTTPGLAFGESGEGHIRISYATSIENINEGLKRVKQAVARL